MNLSRVLNPPKTGFNWAPAWNNEHDFKWNQPYLTRGLNLSRCSNSLNSASGLFLLFMIAPTANFFFLPNHWMEFKAEDLI